MKKIVLFSASALFAVSTLTGCASSSSTLSKNSTLATYDGGTVSSSAVFNQLTIEAGYDTNYTFIKKMLAEIDFANFDAKYHKRFDDNFINQKMKDALKTAGTNEVLYQQLEQSTNLAVTDEASAKKAQRQVQYIQTYILEEYIKDKDVTKAYDQQYGEKMKLKIVTGTDKGSLEDLAKEINNGKLKVDDVINNYTKAKNDNKIDSTGIYKVNDKYSINSAQDFTQGFPKNSGELTSDTESKIFDKNYLNKVVGPTELEGATTTQYFLFIPYESIAATQKLDDTLKKSIRESLASSQIQTAKNLEIALREQRKESGFEIYDSNIKAAFDKYEAYVDTPDQQQSGASAQ